MTECRRKPDGSFRSKSQKFGHQRKLLLLPQTLRQNNFTIQNCVPKAKESASTCEVGFWGDTCDNKCDSRCRCISGCNKLTGECNSCEDDYWGSFCADRCPNVCQESCGSHWRLAGLDCLYSYDCLRRCNQISGICYSCSNGFWGSYCNKTCVPVDRCLRCQNSNGSYCYECKPGFWGTVCENNCLPNCVKCDRNSGRCYSFLGCNKGYYGSNCENLCFISNCEKCSNNSYCQECVYGYWRPRCSSCSDLHCASCNHFNGKCDKCKDGYWGDRCEYECTKHCAETHCDMRSGMCSSCKDGYWGDYCNDTCTLDQCSSFGECSKENGPVCYQCIPGRWGNLCEYECSTNCTDGCKKSTGECYVIENGVKSSLKTTVQETSSSEITSTELSSRTAYKAYAQISETTIIGISIGSSLSVVIVFMVAAFLIFIFCYARLKANVEKKSVLQKDGIRYCTEEQKVTHKGFDNPTGLRAQNDLYEIPTWDLVANGNTPVSNNDMAQGQEHLYANCRINAV